MKVWNLAALALWVGLGCSAPKKPSADKTVFLVLGDVQVCGGEDRLYTPVQKGQGVSNRDILTVADEARCGVAVGRDTLLIAGGSRLNISSKIEEGRVVLKVVAASGRVFLACADSEPAARSITLATSEAQGLASQGVFALEKDDVSTRFQSFSGQLQVKDKKTGRTLTLLPGETVTLPCPDTGTGQARLMQEDEIHRLEQWVSEERAARYFNLIVPKKAALQSDMKVDTSAAKREPRGQIRASAGHNVKSLVDVPVKFFGAGTYPGGKIVRYEWDFDNDGTVDFKSESSGEAEYAYPKAGTYNSVLVVYGEDGSSAQSTLNVEILEKAAGKSGP
jgi:hypothetical protein